jgi:phosphoglycerate dehydrogenase-like enzyme
MRRLVVDLASAGTAWRVPSPDLQAIREALGTGWDVVEVGAPAVALTEADGAVGTPEAAAAAHGAEVYFGFGVPAGVAAAARNTLRWAHSGTAGVGAALRHLAGTRAILTNSAAMHAEPTADWVIASIAYFARGLDRMREAQDEHRWARDEFAELRVPVVELTDVRVGVFGLGGIGSAVARRALALGMPVAAVRRRPELGGPAGMRWVGGLADLPRLAAESDCLVIAAAQTRETAGVVDDHILDRLPSGAVVINVSRGQLLPEDSLLRALDSGRLRGAALDVFAKEPLPSGHRFWDHPRVLVSPHAAAVSSRFWERETGLILENVRRYLAGAPLLNVVDQEAGY